MTGNAQNLQKAKKQTIEKEKHDSRQNASIVDEAAANTSATKQQPEEAPQLSGTISSSSLSDFGMLFWKILRENFFREKTRNHQKGFSLEKLLFL